MIISLADLDKCPKSPKIAALFEEAICSTEFCGTDLGIPHTHTQQEIADAVGMAQQSLADRLKVLPDLDKCPKSVKIAALFEETLSDLDKCPKPIKIAARARRRSIALSEF
jgi:DNA-binding XRE family transcriptional regulator